MGGPPIVTHGTIVDANTGLMLVPEEHLAIQGENVLGGEEEWQCCWQKVLKVLLKSTQGVNAVKRLAGNAQQPPNLGTRLVYCLSCSKVDKI